MDFKIWWRENKPEDIPVDSYHLVKEACRSAWERAKEEERARAYLLANTYPFSPHVSKTIAKLIEGKNDGLSS